MCVCPKNFHFTACCLVRFVEFLSYKLRYVLFKAKEWKGWVKGTFVHTTFDEGSIVKGPELQYISHLNQLL